MKNSIFKIAAFMVIAVGGGYLLTQCGTSSPDNSGGVMSGSTAEEVFVPPGEHDTYYAFTSGGYSGQVGVYGLPSGRLFRVIPVFSQDAEKGYGYNEETKPMLETSFGFVPWDDSHHPELSQTNGEIDGRFMFINGNNTPRVAKINLSTMETEEIIEIPNAGGNHASAFITENTEYITASTRFSVPVPQADEKIASYADKFNGVWTFISFENEDMEIGFQVLAPPFNWDLAHGGKGKSHGWMFFSSYNAEKANTLLEKNASQLDKDFIAAVNWKLAEEYLAQGKAHDMQVDFRNNEWDESTQMATSHERNTVKVLIPEECPGLVYLLPTPKSPHGVDVDPTGNFIVGGGKLSADMAVHSFDKMLQAIENEDFETTIDGIPVLKYDNILQGIVKQPGLGPLHTEFDGRGNAYTTFFISSEIVKWKVETQEILDRVPTYYSVGHLMIPGGDSRKPEEGGKYMVAMNKITKDRYLPTGPELAHSAQLYDISGDKMRLILDFPTVGEPHYAQGLLASRIKDKQVKTYLLEENKHPHVTDRESRARVERDGNVVRVYMTAIRSHLAPDNIEGIRVGDEVYFHVTNLEQDWDVPHGFAMMGATNAELLIMPGQTETLLWKPTKEGVFPFYCTDFCSALHQEMQGYVRVSPRGSNVPLSWALGDETGGATAP